MKDKYPIGPYLKSENINPEQIAQWILILEQFPSQVETLTAQLSPEKLQYTYREGGWNIAQIVHHCADSHLNSYIRFKKTLTESDYVVQPYDEKAWALLPDANNFDISPSLLILKGLHQRWTQLLQNVSDAQLKKTFVHPEHQNHFTLEEYIGFYAWHSLHHAAHIKKALEKATIS